MKRIHLLKEPNLLVKYDAFPYQKEAFEAIKDLDYAAIFHEQGLGKTKIAIDLLLYWLERTSIDTVLIVTKKQLVQNWIREFRNHTFIHPAVIDTNRQNNYYVFSGPSRVVITNFETLVSEKERYQLFLRTRNVAIIIDESAKLKNPSSNLTRAFFELAPLFQKRVIMTGTPVANRPYDIWAQIFFLDYGESLGTDFNEFKRQTDLSNNLADNETLRKSFEGDVSEIYERIKTFTVRETKNSGIIELPDKVFIRESAYFSSEQEALYDKICDELRVEVEKDGQIVITVSNEENGYANYSVGEDEFVIVYRYEKYIETVSQIDFTKLDNMPFDFNELGDEEDNIFNNSYFNNDSIPNENHQQDNNDQPTNTQKEQTLDKYGFVTYGHKTNGTNDEELFALDHAHEFDGQSI